MNIFIPYFIFTYIITFTSALYSYMRTLVTVWYHSFSFSLKNFPQYFLQGQPGCLVSISYKYLLMGLLVDQITYSDFKQFQVCPGFCFLFAQNLTCSQTYSYIPLSPSGARVWPCLWPAPPWQNFRLKLEEGVRTALG